MESQPSEPLQPKSSSASPPPLTYTGYFEQERFSPPLVALSALFALFFIYQIGGAILTILFVGPTSTEISDWSSTAIRLSQGLSQIFFLALPTFMLVSLHTGKWLFSTANFEFLALYQRPPATALFSASLAIVAMSPFLSYVGDVQLVIMNDVLGWRESIGQMYKQYKALLEGLTAVHSATEFVLVVVIVALVPAVCEECLFRGYVQKNFSRAMSATRAAVLTGVIFGLYHINPVQLIPLVILGIYLSYLRSSSGTLILPMIAHFVNNFFSVLGLMAVRHKDVLGLDEAVLRRLHSDEPDISSPTAILAMLLSAGLTLALVVLYQRSLKHRMAA
jgi:membrane protease YdiL (CAAX protease family)